jgi:aldose 1-epimerase
MMLIMQHVVALLCTVGALAGGRATYVVGDDSFGKGSEAVHLKVLRNTQTGELVEVAWKYGGRTEALLLRNPSGRVRPVLMTSGRNASLVHNNEGFRGDMLAPYANRIRNGTYSLNGQTYYLERNEDRKKYGKGGLHGYLYRKEMRVVDARGGDDNAMLVLDYEFDGTDPGYPFPLHVKLTYILDAKGFTLQVAASNKAPQGMSLPFMFSWHSYFLVNEVAKAVVELDRCSPWNHIDVTDGSNSESDLIPTGLTTPFTLFDGKLPVGGTRQNPTYWDDEFKATASVEKCPRLEVRVSDPTTRDTSVLWMDSHFRWVQVFSGAPSGQGVSSQAIAVEAMSGEADAWNNKEGVQLLQAGETFLAEFGVRVETYDPSNMIIV